MTTTTIRNANVSQQVLERTPERALQFLRGIKYKPVCAILQRGGYGAEDHKEGWLLMQRACGFHDDIVAIDDEGAEAVKELDAWDEKGLARAEACLTRLHPEQAEFVFRGGLKASEGMQAVMGVHTFLDRLDELEKSTERKATRKADKAALDTLAKRGIDDGERKRLRKLVDAVKAKPIVDDGGADTEAERLQALVALRSWFEDWSKTARSIVSRRDHLIRLGLAKRKTNGKIEDVVDDTDNDDPQPPKPEPTPVG